MNKSFKYLLFFILACICHFSCDRNPETSTGKISHGSGSEDSIDKKLFSGNPDIPRNPYQITSAGIGSVLLGDSVEKLCKFYDCSSSESLNIWEDGKEWPARKVFLENKKYILAEMINTVGLISKLSTNDLRVKATNGIRPGLSLDSIPLLKDSLQADHEHKAFSYGRTGVWFKTDEKTSSRYFKSKDPQIIYLKGGKISEVFIICADC